MNATDLHVTQPLLTFGLLALTGRIGLTELNSMDIAYLLCYINREGYWPRFAYVCISVHFGRRT